MLFFSFVAMSDRVHYNYLLKMLISFPFVLFLSTIYGCFLLHWLLLSSVMCFVCTTIISIIINNVIIAITITVIIIALNFPLDHYLRK